MGDLIQGLKNIMVDNFIDIFGNPAICSTLHKAILNKDINIDKLDNNITLNNVLLDTNNPGHGFVGYKIVFSPVEYVNLVYLNTASPNNQLECKILDKALEPLDICKHYYMFIYRKDCLIAVRVVIPADFKKRFDIVSNDLKCDCGDNVSILNYKNVFYSHELNIIYPKCDNCI